MRAERVSGRGGANRGLKSTDQGPSAKRIVASYIATDILETAAVIWGMMRHRLNRLEGNLVDEEERA